MPRWNQRKLEYTKHVEHCCEMKKQQRSFPMETTHNKREQSPTEVYEQQIQYKRKSNRWTKDQCLRRVPLNTIERSQMWPQRAVGETDNRQYETVVVKTATKNRKRSDGWNKLWIEQKPSSRELQNNHLAGKGKYLVRGIEWGGDKHTTQKRRHCSYDAMLSCVATEKNDRELSLPVKVVSQQT